MVSHFKLVNLAMDMQPKQSLSLKDTYSNKINFISKKKT